MNSNFFSNVCPILVQTVDEKKKKPKNLRSLEILNNNIEENIIDFEDICKQFEETVNKDYPDSLKCRNIDLGGNGYGGYNRTGSWTFLESKII